MIKIEMQGFEGAVRSLRGLEKQARFAAAQTVNQLAVGPVRDALRHEMEDSLDRPTPFTLNSIALIKRATREDPSAVIDFKDVAGGGRPAANYLRWQVEGGERRLKAFERMLRSVGALPGGYFVVPGAGAQLDAYGNVSRGLIVAILSYFQAFPEEGRGWKMNSTEASRRRKATSTRKRRGVAYFVGRPGDGRGPLGIWRRTQVFGYGTEIRPVFIFVQSVRYEPRLDLRYAAQLAVQRNAPALFRANLTRALGSAR